VCQNCSLPPEACKNCWLAGRWIDGYGESLSSVDFSAAPRGLELPAPRVGFLLREINLLAKSLHCRAPFDGIRHLPCRFLVLHISAIRSGELKSPPAEPYDGGRHTYDEVLPGALKASFETISPTQGYAAIGTMPHTLASEDQSPVCRPRTLPPRRGRPRLDFLGWFGGSSRGIIWRRLPSRHLPGRDKETHENSHRG
jgi:hypothetical protein